jgi:hypothetical protein
MDLGLAPRSLGIGAQSAWTEAIFERVIPTNPSWEPQLARERRRKGLKRLFHRPETVWPVKARTHNLWGPARVPYSAGALRAAKVTLGTIAQAAATMTAQANSETKVRCSE